MCMPASITHSAPAAHYNALPLSLSLSLLTAVAVCCCYIHRHVDGPAAEMALPNLLQLMRSKEGVQGLVEYYTGQPLVDSRVLHISTTSEWKEALDQAGDRPVCALFTNGEDVGCRVLAPVFARLPDAGDGSEFGEVDFLAVTLDTRKDDGLVGMVFDEAYVAKEAVPTFVFVQDCLELKKWRYQGANVKEVTKRLRRIVTNDHLDDGPDAEDE